MRLIKLKILVCPALLALVCLTPVAARAEEGRGFAGRYSLTHVVDDGAQVHLTSYQ